MWPIEASNAKGASKGTFFGYSVISGIVAELFESGIVALVSGRVWFVSTGVTESLLSRESGST